MTTAPITKATLESELHTQISMVEYLFFRDIIARLEEHTDMTADQIMRDLYIYGLCTCHTFAQLGWLLLKSQNK